MKLKLLIMFILLLVCGQTGILSNKVTAQRKNPVVKEKKGARITITLNCGAEEEIRLNEQWIPWTTDKKDFPSNAIKSGIEPEKSGPLYICRANYQPNGSSNVSLQPGKIVFGRCNISYAGKEIPKDQYEILVGNENEALWQEYFDPNKVLVAGHEGETPLYICRAEKNGTKHAGKIVNGKCNYPYGGEELISDDFEVLYKINTIRPTPPRWCLYERRHGASGPYLWFTGERTYSCTEPIGYNKSQVWRKCD